MQAKTTPLLFLQDFVVKISSATSRVAILLSIIIFSNYNCLAQGGNGQSVINNRQSYSESYEDENVGESIAGVSPFSEKTPSARIQYLYLVDEFGNIRNDDFVSEISFKILPVVASVRFSNVTVRLGYTADISWKGSGKEKFATFPSPNLVEVFSGALTVPLDGSTWVTLNLDTPFQIKSPNTLMQNIILEISYTYEAQSYDDQIEFFAMMTKGLTMDDFGVRGVYYNGSSLGAPSGKDLFSTPSLFPGCTFIDRYNTLRHLRPKVKFRYKSTFDNSKSGTYVQSTPVYCEGESIEVKLDNVFGSGIKGYQWMESSDNISFTPIPNATSTSVALSQKLEKQYVKCRITPQSGSIVNGVVAGVIDGVNTYNGEVLGWSHINPPAPNESAYFKADYEVQADEQYCSVGVASGAVVIVKSGKTLTANSKLTIAAGGHLNFENNASLMQSEGAVNVGDIEYLRNTSLLNRYDYVYYSSPVFGQTLHNLSPGTLADKFYSFINNDWHLETNLNIPMKPGKGYIIRAPQSFDISGNPQIFPAIFTGPPNNGEIQVDVNPVVDKYNLIGNPYPSAVWSLKFLQDNSFLDGTIHLWRHLNGPASTPDANGIYNYSDDNYTSVNITGATDGTLSYKVAAGQSFMVKTIAAGHSIAKWQNSHRFYSQEGQVFYKNATNNHTQGIAKALPSGRVWLQVRNSVGKFQNMLLGYIEGATNGYDNGYDSEQMQASSMGLFGIDGNLELGIMARGLPFSDDEIVSLGYSTTSVGIHTIEKFQEDGFIANYDVFLNDKLTNTLHNLSQGAYSFSSAVGTFKNRFVMSFKKKVLTTIDNGVKPNSVVVYDKANALQLHSNQELMKNVIIYDLSGKVLAKMSNIKSLNVALESITRTGQLIIVEVLLENGIVEVQKFQF